MSVKIDTEDVVKNVLALVKAQLNTEIGLINTAKADNLTVPLVNANAYYFASMPEGAFNYPNFVVYGFLDNPQLESIQGDNNIRKIDLFFEVVSVDEGKAHEQNIIYKLLRYSRALESIFLKDLNKVMQGYGNIEVAQLVPSSLFSVDGKTIRSAGVSITARITAR